MFVIIDKNANKDHTTTATTGDAQKVNSLISLCRIYYVIYSVIDINMFSMHRIFCDKDNEMLSMTETNTFIINHYK